MQGQANRNSRVVAESKKFPAQSARCLAALWPPSTISCQNFACRQRFTFESLLRINHCIRSIIVFDQSFHIINHFYIYQSLHIHTIAHTHRCSYAPGALPPRTLPPCTVPPGNVATTHQCHHTTLSLCTSATTQRCIESLFLNFNVASNHCFSSSMLTYVNSIDIFLYINIALRHYSRSSTFPHIIDRLDLCDTETLHVHTYPPCTLPPLRFVTLFPLHFRHDSIEWLYAHCTWCATRRS